jgi:hypothetical protein
LLAYKDFLDRVKRIANSNLTPEQAYRELNDAAFIAVIATVGDIALSRLSTIGEILGFLLMGWLFAFEKVWFDEPII